MSQSGLAKILQEVRDHGLPKTLSRSSVKRARDNAIPHDLFTTVLLVDDSGAEHRYPAVNPWKQFEWMVYIFQTIYPRCPPNSPRQCGIALGHMLVL